MTLAPFPRLFLCAALAAGSLCSVAAAQVTVLATSTNDNGYFVPFTPANANTVRYGDSLWIDCFAPQPFELTQIDFGLATWNGPTDGSTNIILTITDGDPSGLVFGTAQVLYQTTLSIALPAASSDPLNPSLFNISVPLPNVRTLGGCNNVGYSFRLQNYNYAGRFGFQCSTANAQALGFYTNNASFFNGTSWSLFAFGPNPITQIAQFTTTVYGRPYSPPVACNPADIAQTDGAPGPSGNVDNGDFQLFFSSFFSANCPACGTPTTTPCNPADIAATDGSPAPVGDGCVDNGDFSLFFSSFFAGC